MTCHPRLGGAAAGEAKLRGSSEYILNEISHEIPVSTVHDTKKISLT